MDLSDNPNINTDGINIIKNKMQNNNVLKELLCLNLSATNLNDIALKYLDEIIFPKLKKLILQDIDFSKNENIVGLINIANYNNLLFVWQKIGIKYYDTI